MQNAKEKAPDRISYHRAGQMMYQHDLIMNLLIKKSFACLAYRQLTFTA